MYEKVKFTLQALKMIEPNILDDFTYDFLEDDSILAQELYLKTYERPMLATITPEYFKLVAKHFLDKNYKRYKRIYETVNLEYNPLENYDRYEDTSTSSEGRSNGASSSDTDNTNTEQISAEDSENFVNQGKSVFDGHTSGTEDTSYIDGGTVTSHIHGNIGVTTATQMQQQVTNYYSKMDVIGLIVNDFIVDSDLWYYYFT